LMTANSQLQTDLDLIIRNLNSPNNKMEGLNDLAAMLE